MNVVLLPALAMSSAMWADQRAALERSGHNVIAPEPRAYPAEPSLDVVADDLARALEGRDVPRAVIAGSSMGGYVAMAFLRRHPGRVAGLALLATRAAADTPEIAAERHAFAALIVDSGRREGLLDAAVPRLVGATTRAERADVVAHVRGMAEAAPPETVAWCQRAIAARSDSFDTLRTADIPAVVIAGAEDELVTGSDTRAMADALPRGELVTVPAAGHLTPVEAPAVVTTALLDLVRGSA